MAGAVRFAASHYGTCGNVLNVDIRGQAYTYLVDDMQRRTPSDAGPNYPVSFSKSNAGPDYTSAFELFRNGSGYPTNREIAKFTANDYDGRYNAVNAADGIPRRYIVMSDGAGNRRMFINGSSVTLTSEGKTLSSSTASTDDLYIGNQQGFTSTFYSDFMRGPYIWLSDKGDSWAAAQGDYGYALPDATGAYLALKLNEGTGTSAADSSGNGRTCTLSSSGLWVPFEFSISVSNRRRQQVTPVKTDTTDTTPITLVFGSNVVAGSLLTVAVTHHNTGGNTTLAVTDSQGNTYVQADGSGGNYISNGNCRVSVWSTIAGSSAACTITLTQSATCFFQATAWEHTGPWTSAAAEDTKSATAASGSPTLGTVTPAGTGRLIIAIAEKNASPLNGGYSNSMIGCGVLNRAAGGIITAFQECFTDVAVSVNWSDSAPQGGSADWGGSANLVALAAIYAPAVSTGNSLYYRQQQLLACGA